MKVLIFGATGSIGKQAIDIIKKNKFQLVGISYFNNYSEAQKIIKKFHLKYYYSPNFNSPVNSYEQLIIKTKPNIILNSIIGSPGLGITLLSLKHKIDLALANKESLVMAGSFIKSLAKKNKVNIYPIDSEHSSAMQLIKKFKKYDQLYITASGGNYYDYSIKELSKIQYSQAIKHRKWNMGEKISIDSSTLINKYFELIEGYWLFNKKNIDVFYNPTVSVHAVIKVNQKYYGYYCPNDMRIFIEMALNRYQTIDSNNIKEIKNLKKEKLFRISNKKIPIKWARDAIKYGIKYQPIIVNACNDILIEKYKNKKISLDKFIPTISFFLKKYQIINIKNINDVYIFDKLIRQEAKYK